MVLRSEYSVLQTVTSIVVLAAVIMVGLVVWQAAQPPLALDGPWPDEAMVLPAHSLRTTAPAPALFVGVAEPKADLAVQ